MKTPLMTRNHPSSLIAILIIFSLALFPAADSAAAETPYPTYKPSSRAPAQDIRSNAYGASRSAPEALGIGDTVPDFVVPRAGGGQVSLVNARARGPVAIIFYRGHW